jgi:hypothetical protein
MNVSVKSGYAKTGAVARAFLNFSKASFAADNLLFDLNLVLD